MSDMLIAWLMDELSDHNDSITYASIRDSKHQLIVNLNKHVLEIDEYNLLKEMNRWITSNQIVDEMRDMYIVDLTINQSNSQSIEEVQEKREIESYIGQSMSWNEWVTVDCMIWYDIK